MCRFPSLFLVMHYRDAFSTVWAWDGYGHSKSLKQGVKEDEGKHSIIVSRSHAGEVEKVAKDAFGDNVEIVQAGGAGKSILISVEDCILYQLRISRWVIRQKSQPRKLSIGDSL